MNETKLRELIIHVIEQLENEGFIIGPGQNRTCCQKKMYILLSGCWNQRFADFFEKMRTQTEYDMYAVIPESQVGKGIQALLEPYKNIQVITHREELPITVPSEYITVFPVLLRDTMIKAALCICDSLETRWIRAALEQGQKIFVLKSGLERFTGHEPQAYKDRIMYYLRKLLEYGIEIAGLDETDDYPPEIMGAASKKIITVSDVESYVQDKKLVMKKGDILTDLAKDKALALGIELVQL